MRILFLILLLAGPWFSFLVPDAAGQNRAAPWDTGPEALVPLLPEGTRLPGNLVVEPPPGNPLPAAGDPGPQAVADEFPETALWQAEKTGETGGAGPFPQHPFQGTPAVPGPHFQYPDQLLQGPWLEIKHNFLKAPVPQLQAYLNRLYEASLDTGFSNSPAYALLLLRLAHQLLEAGDLVRARAVGETACNLAPAFYPAPAFMAGLMIREPRRGFLPFLSWWKLSWKQRLSSFAWQVRFAGSLVLIGLLTFYVFFLFLGLYFLVRYGKIFLHALRERARPGFWGTYQQVGVLATVLLAGLLLPGVFWVAVSAGLLLCRYARKWEKLLFGLFLLFWAFSPGVFLQAGRFLAAPPFGVQALLGCTQGDWDARADSSLRAALEKGPDSPDLCLAAAVVAKRRGDLARAGEILAGAVERFPGNGALWNNLGNLQAIQGRTEQAKGSYLDAIEADLDLASARYNLSLLLRREFAFIEGGREFDQARNLDSRRVDYFVYTHSQNANRFFMDEDPSLLSCWRSFFHDNPEAREAAERLWQVGGAGVPLAWTPWIFAPLAALVAVWMARGGTGGPFRCSGCGIIACGRCQPGTRFAGLCNPCYQTLYERDHIVRERRNMQIHRMAGSQARRSRGLVLLNLFLPGLGTSVQEDKIAGMLFLLVFVFGVLEQVLWSRLPFSPVQPWEKPQEVYELHFAAGLLAVYLVFQILSFKKLLSKG